MLSVFVICCRSVCGYWCFQFPVSSLFRFSFDLFFSVLLSASLLFLFMVILLVTGSCDLVVPVSYYLCLAVSDDCAFFVFCDLAVYVSCDLVFFVSLDCVFSVFRDFFVSGSCGMFVLS